MTLVGFEAWARLAGDSPTSRTEWAAVVAAWGEPHRRYHDLRHLAAVLGLVGELAGARPLGADRLVVAAAGVVDDVVVPGGQPHRVGVGRGAGQLTHQPEDGGQVPEVVVAAVRLAPRGDDGGPLGAGGGGVAGQGRPLREVDAGHGAESDTSVPRVVTGRAGRVDDVRAGRPVSPGSTR